MEKTVIFDMDGVIFDTEALCLSCWKRVCDKYGVSGIEDVFRECIGTTAARTSEIVRRHMGESFDYETFRRETSALMHKKSDEDGMPIKPGVRELLTFLSESGYRIGLASSTRRKVVEQELEQAGLLSFFFVLIGGDMVRRGKPDPEIYVRACAEMQVNPAEAFAIEDSFHGVRAAHSAGMRVLMVPDLVPPDETMRELAYGIYPSLVEVLDFFKEM